MMGYVLRGIAMAPQRKERAKHNRQLKTSESACAQERARARVSNEYETGRWTVHVQSREPLKVTTQA